MVTSAKDSPLSFCACLHGEIRSYFQSSQHNTEGNPNLLAAPPPGHTLSEHYPYPKNNADVFVENRKQIDPVRIESLETFGTPEEVGARVLKVEQAKDGTLDTKLLDTSAEKQGDLSLYTLVSVWASKGRERREAGVGWGGRDWCNVGEQKILREADSDGERERDDRGIL